MSDRMYERAVKQAQERRLPKIFDKERRAFKRLWHNYHLKYRIPYLHDEAEAIFNSIVEIFREDKR